LLSLLSEFIDEELEELELEALDDLLKLVDLLVSGDDNFVNISKEFDLDLKSGEEVDELIIVEEKDIML
jgi:hypothetical protein